MGRPTGGVSPTSNTENDYWGDMEYMIVIAVLATVLFLVIIVCITKCICSKCCGRTFKITCEEFQAVSIDHVNVDEAEHITSGGYYNPRRGRDVPWITTTYSNRGFNGGFLHDPLPSGVSGSPPQFWELGDGNPQVRALDASSLTGQYTYTYDGHFRARSDETPSPIPALTDGGMGTSFQADHQLQELVRAGMSQSETIMVGSKLVVFISREVNHLGDTLVLNEMGISLTIPPHAIEVGRTERISLILDWDLGDFPGMSDDQTIISPVVHCGPHGLKLNKPAMLSYRHCAYNINDVSLVASQTHLMQNKDWKEVCSKEDSIRPYTLFPNEVQVQVSHFTLYTCIAEGKTSPNKWIKKWMQLAVFGGKMRAKQHYEIRVYLLNNTPCALQFAVQNEAKNHFKMLCPRKEFLFHGDDQDMLATVQHVNEGWSHRLDDRQERVPFLNIWHGKCPHVSFIFKHENEHVRDIDVRLVLHQQGRETIESDKTCLKVLASMKSNSSSKRNLENIGNSNKAVINVFPSSKRRGSGKRRRYDSTSSVSSRSGSISSLSSDVSSSSNSSVPSSSDTSSDNTSNSSSDDELAKTTDQPTQQPCTQNMKIIINGDESPSPTDFLSQAGSPRTISHELCMELVLLLDPLATLGNDWRILASALELDSLIPLLKDTPAYKPTETLLEEVEHQCKGLQWLASVMIQARRLDAANAVMKYVNTNNTCAENES